MRWRQRCSSRPAGPLRLAGDADQVAIALRPGSNAGDVHVGVFVLNPRFSFSLGYKHAYIFATKLELDDTIQHSESLQVGRFNIGWSFRFSDRVTPYQHLLHRRDSRRAGPGSPVLGPGSLLTEGDGSQRSAPPGSPSGRPSGLVKPLISWAGRKPVRSCAMPACRAATPGSTSLTSVSSWRRGSLPAKATTLISWLGATCWMMAPPPSFTEAGRPAGEARADGSRRAWLSSRWLPRPGSWEVRSAQCSRRPTNKVSNI